MTSPQYSTKQSAAVTVVEPLTTSPVGTYIYLRHHDEVVAEYLQPTPMLAQQLAVPVEKITKTTEKGTLS